MGVFVLSPNSGPLCAIRNTPVWLDMAFLPESGRHKLPSYITDILPLKFQHSLVVPTEALVSVVRWILRNGGLAPECGSSAADKRTGWDCDGNYGIKQEPIFPWFFLFTRQHSGDFSEQNCRISFPTHSLTGPGKLFRSAISRIVALYTFPFVVTWSLASQWISPWWRAHRCSQFSDTLSFLLLLFVLPQSRLKLETHSEKHLDGQSLSRWKSGLFASVKSCLVGNLRDCFSPATPISNLLISLLMLVRWWHFRRTN